MAYDVPVEALRDYKIIHMARPGAIKSNPTDENELDHICLGKVAPFKHDAEAAVETSEFSMASLSKTLLTTKKMRPE